MRAHGAEQIKGLGLLSAKPIIYAANVLDSDLATPQVRGSAPTVCTAAPPRDVGTCLACGSPRFPTPHGPEEARGGACMCLAAHSASGRCGGVPLSARQAAGNAMVEKVREFAAAEGSATVIVSAQVEAELVELDEDGRWVESVA